MEEKDDKSKSKEEKRWLITGMVIFGFLALVSLVITFQNRPTELTETELFGFADCVKTSGAKMYGAYWCPHCQDNKDLFGPAWESMVDMVYVECDEGGENPQTELCQEVGIEGFPTWIYPGGTAIPGVNDLKTISDFTGCELN